MPSGPHRVLAHHNLTVPLRDGTTQWADLYLPDTSGPLPAILERSPYEKGRSSEVQVDAHNFFASHGYAFIVTDVRGRFRGEGEFYPFRDDARDGYDTVEWIAAQPWCNGQVGMIGGSYSGATQYQVMALRPPHLRCLFSRQSSADYHEDWVFRGGAFQLAFMWVWTVRWLLISGEARGDLTSEQIARLKAATVDQDACFAQWPLAPLKLVEHGYDWYNEWLDRCDDAGLWNALSARVWHAEVDVPIMHLGAWFDIFQRGSFDHFTGLRRLARTPHARRWQRMIVGPWIHGPLRIPERVQGEVDFGPAAGLDFNELRLPWYDLWLKRDRSAVDRTHWLPLDDDPLKLFLMGANKWRNCADWPPPDATFTDWFLRPNAMLGRAPVERAEPQTFVYDPMKPTLSLGGHTLYVPGGPVDQRPAESSGLIFTTEPLDDELTVIGPVRAVLHASSSCRDTDWVVRLTDVLPDGRSLLVCDGILRARYRESRWQPSLLEPGRVYRFEIDLWNTAHVFARGHRLRVAVCSSSFPRFDRNPNTGARLYFNKHREVAHNTIYLDATQPSYLVLPVVPNEV